MKLCPQCDFIYEDSQALCDMDGNELVYEPTLSISSERSLPGPIDGKQKRSGSRWTVVRILAALVLVASLGLLYKVLTPGSEMTKADPFSAGKTTAASLPGAVPIAEKTASPAPTPDLAKAHSVSEAARQAAQSTSTDDSASARTDSKSPNNHAVVNHPPVPLSVYSLPRVKPLPTLKPIPKLADKETARSAPTRKPAIENKKKDSKVGSFLKKTARVLTKPFQR